MQLTSSSLPVLLLLLLDSVCANLIPRADKPPKEPDPECTVTNPLTNEFYDLRPLIRHGSDQEDWHIPGHDYGRNFTLNICEPVLSDYSDVVRVNDRTNVSGYYVDSHGDKISIGRANRFPYFRGRRLLLEYKDGSKCEDGLHRRTLISFLCDREREIPSLNFLSAPFDCVYVFDIRTSRACPTVPPPQASSSVSPLGVFAIIGGVALVVYFFAGCIYRRRVLHKVGWSQVPHIDALSGTFSFIWDMIVILFANTVGRIPGISKLFTRNRTSSGRGRIAIDDENALIDEVDDEY